MKRIFRISTLLLLLLAGCSKTKSPNAPDKAILTFPAQNAVCTTGTFVSSTQSTITFTWNTSLFTDSYEVNIKNLITGVVTTQMAITNQLIINLLRDTPYSWYVVSRSSAISTISQSDTWKFYNAGIGTISHPPFPADALKPTLGQNITAATGSVNLSWAGSDPDNDLLGYDVYFGTGANPPLLKNNITDTFLNLVPVTSSSIYYWKIITKDNAGNTSDSGIFQFKVN